MPLFKLTFSKIQLDIAYAPVFDPLAIPITLTNLVYERASVIFNLAALYSQLAEGENRSTSDGIKRAAANYQVIACLYLLSFTSNWVQQAAGTLSFLQTSVLPKLVLSPNNEEISLDLSDAFLKGVEWLMLAQAQECSWQLAKLGALHFH